MASIHSSHCMNSYQAIRSINWTFTKINIYALLSRLSGKGGANCCQHYRVCIAGSPAVLLGSFLFAFKAQGQISHTYLSLQCGNGLRKTASMNHTPIGRTQQTPHIPYRIFLELNLHMREMMFYP